MMASAAAMLEVYRQQKESLIHNDLHAGQCCANMAGAAMYDVAYVPTCLHYLP
jgi:5-methylthioribose kinase